MAGSVKNMSSDSLTSVITKGVSEGVAKALQVRDAIADKKADSAAMMEQHLKVTGQMKADDKMSKVSDNIKTMADNQKSITELFASVSRSLSLMSSQTISPSSSSQLANQAESPIQSMSLSSMVDNVGSIGRAVKNFSVSSGSSSASMPTPSPVDSSQGYQEAITSPVAAEKNDYDASNKKALADEEDRLFKEAARPVIPKLSRALDMYLDDRNSAVNNGGSAGDSLMGLLATMGGGIVGFAFGYLSKFANMWKNVGANFAKSIKAGWDFLQKTNLGKKITELGTKFKGAITGGINKIGELGTKVKSIFTDGIAKVSELKSSFTNMVSGWKNTLKESVLGKAAAKTADVAKQAGGFLSSLAKKAGSGLLNGAKSLGSTIIGGVKAAGSAIANSGIAQKAIKAAKFGANLGKKIPVIQAAGTALDTAVNIYKAAQNGASMKDMVRMGVSGAVDMVSDTFMIPEMMNAANGAIDAAVHGKGIGGIIKGAGSGFMKSRDANDISMGNALVAKTMNGIGLGDASTRAISKASDQGLGWKEAGFETVSGAAGGFGHSAAIYRPKAAGSLENTKSPNATVAPNLPTEAPMSESEKMTAYIEGVKEGVKEAMLSPEVQEANAKNAKETGAAINGQLFGG